MRRSLLVLGVLLALCGLAPVSPALATTLRRFRIYKVRTFLEYVLVKTDNVDSLTVLRNPICGINNFCKDVVIQILKRLPDYLPCLTFVVRLKIFYILEEKYRWTLRFDDRRQSKKQIPLVPQIQAAIGHHRMRPDIVAGVVGRSELALLFVSCWIRIH